MEITDELLEKLAGLARLNIDKSNKEQLKKDLSEILSWMEKLNEVDTSDVDPLTNMSIEVDRWREDVAGNTLDRDTALKNAPESDGKFFKVPKVLKNK